jgi:Flp pilus assembly protein TadD
MRSGMARALIVALAGLWMAGCSSSGNLFNKTAGQTPAADPAAPTQAYASADNAGAAAPALSVPAADGRQMLGGNPYDDLALGKKQYRANNFGLAEKYFRHAVELHPNDAEAWLGLAACYDRLRRFDLADRAYGQAIRIVGTTAEILNNQGYSYMLRGDYTRARTTLLAAQRKDPGNKYVANNMRLLDEASSKGKNIE